MITTWMGDRYMLGLCPTLRFLWTQILCTLLVSILQVNLHFINRSQLFVCVCVCVYIYHMHAKRSHVMYMHGKLDDPVQCCPCQSLVDSGNIKIAQHALKSVSFQIVGHHTEEKSLNHYSASVIQYMFVLWKPFLKAI